MKYSYKVYANYPRRMFIEEVSANSIDCAIKKANLNWLERDGGRIVKTRKGLGYTNTVVYIYSPEAVASKSKPDFVMERVFD